MSPRKVTDPVLKARGITDDEVSYEPGATTGETPRYPARECVVCGTTFFPTVNRAARRARRRAGRSRL